MVKKYQTIECKFCGKSHTKVCDLCIELFEYQMSDLKYTPFADALSFLTPRIIEKYGKEWYKGARDKVLDVARSLIEQEKQNDILMDDAMKETIDSW